jgi:hypothetical protein
VVVLERSITELGGAVVVDDVEVDGSVRAVNPISRSASGRSLDSTGTPHAPRASAVTTAATRAATANRWAERATGELMTAPPEA